MKLADRPGGAGKRSNLFGGYTVDKDDFPGNFRSVELRRCAFTHVDQLCAETPGVDTDMEWVMQRNSLPSTMTRALPGKLI